MVMHEKSLITVLMATIIFILPMNAQRLTLAKSSANQKMLSQLSNQRAFEYKLRKHKADSVFRCLGLPTRTEDSLGVIINLQGFERDVPTYYGTDNFNAAKTIAVDEVWGTTIDNEILNGAGSEGLVWDGGRVNENHQEFLSGGISRVSLRDNLISLSVHSTHVSGTMIASGVDGMSQGMAPNANIYTYDFNNDIAELASEASDGSTVSNHSYGTLSGWRYDYTSEVWYWYGDIGLSTAEDVKFGFYNTKSRDVDFIHYYAPKYLMVKSAGNERDDGPEIQPVDHLVWDDNWVSSQLIHEPDGGSDGYECLSHMAVAKNNIVVGAVEDVLGAYSAPSDVVISAFSSWGPTDDGRIKPDVVANGSEVYSCSSESNTSYVTYNGTSMAAASVSGVVLLLQQVQELLQPGVKLNSSTIKGLLIHTANECGANSGPDYQYGWGLVNGNDAVRLLTDNALGGGERIVEAELKEGVEYNKNISIAAGVDYLKITLCWTDPPADPPTYNLNPMDLMLVNDLNLVLSKDDDILQYYPWVLNPDTPSNPAFTGVNYRDNVEQIVVEAPEAGEYTINISHNGSMFNAKQSFSLLITGIELNDDILPAKNLRYMAGDEYVRLDFSFDPVGSWRNFNIYRNNDLLTTCTDTFYVDAEVYNNEEYEYFVTVMYNDELESVPTNIIHAIPQRPFNIPYSFDFEQTPVNWSLKNDMSGWRYGDSDSLSSYYLDFSYNSSSFIGVDSYTASEGVHTWDFASTPPFNLKNCEDVTLEFDYHFVTGIYGAIDELKLVYKTTGQVEWTEISSLERTFNWSNFKTELPVEAFRDNVVFAYYYDDLYKWGMGAGIDNFAILGHCLVDSNTDIQPVLIEEPISNCVLTGEESLVVEVKNNGPFNLDVDTRLEISLKVNEEEPVNEHFILSSPLAVDSTLLYRFLESVDFQKVGVYNIEISADFRNDSDTSNNILTKTINHWGNPVLDIIDLEDGYCRNEEPVPLIGLPYGGVFSGNGVFDSVLNVLDVFGDSTIVRYSYIDSNNCSADTSYVVDVYTLREAHILYNDTAVCAQSPKIILECIPEGGVLSGSGIDGNEFNPTIDNVGMNLLYYQFTDIHACVTQDVVLIEVLELPQVHLSAPVRSVCANSPPLPLTLLPENGFLSGVGADANMFHPNSSLIGDNTIVYEVISEGGCKNSDTLSILVLNSESVIFGEDSIVACDNALPFEIDAEPVGGVFYGAGMIGDLFYPSNVGAGKYFIKYALDEYCDFDSILISIYEAPVADCLEFDSVICQNSLPIDLNELSADGLFTGTGVYDGLFNPAVCDTGVNYITYSIISDVGCVSEYNYSFSIFSAPNIFLGVDTVITLSDTLMLYPVSDGQILTWSDSTHTATKEIVGADYGIGDYQIFVVAENKFGCSNADSLLISIQAGSASKMLSSDNNFTILPNPVTEKFTLYLNDNSLQPEYMKLYDVNGRLIRSYFYSEMGQYDVSQISAGVYIILVKQSGYVYSLKLVKR